MKHMKRALSLVLAMVMLLGMFVVPTGAVSNFADAEEITYNEAVEITSGIGLFAGSNGKFMPKGTVTRAQMATIIVKMLHGSDANADSFKGATGGFTDTASFEGGWAEGYINWCASLGVVAGYGDGTFRPGQAVTTAEAVTMILNALKVNAGEGQWPLTVMSKAEELKFFQELDTKPETNQALNREELAVIAFAGLEYSPEGKNEYICNGVTYDSYMAAYLAAGRDATKVETVKAGSLSSKVYGLKSVSGFITGNQALGLDCTELQTVVEGNVATYQFDIESDQTAIGHYVTVYYDELYINDKKPGKTYTIFDEGVVVEVTEDIDSRNEFRAAFGSTGVKLSTGTVCVVDADYEVVAGYPRAGFASGDVTFVTDEPYNVAAGTYIVNEKDVVAYIAPAAVYASVIDASDSFEGEETITLRGVLDPIPNDEGNDMIDEYVAMKVGDYVTYTKVGPRYVLERVRVATGTVSALSKTKINGVEYDTVTVGGTDYVDFSGVRASNLGLQTSVSELNYVDTYDFYTTRDNKFIGFKPSDGALNLDNVAYILGVLSTVKKDAFDDQVITFNARGIDMNGVETMIPVAMVKDTNRNGQYDSGEEILGDENIAKGGSMAENFYAVKDHTDKDERKEGIKALTAYGTTYNKETSPVFVSPYTLRNLVFGGNGTFSCGYSLNSSTSKYLIMEGTATQGTALSATVKTGSCSVSMDNNIEVAQALLTRAESGAYMVQAMIFRVKSEIVSVGGQTIYVSKDKNTPAANNASGYIYDVYAATTGKETQITLDTGSALRPGFYQVALNKETQQHEFVNAVTEANRPADYVDGWVIPTAANANTLKENGTTNSGKDGLPNYAVCYDIPFSYMASSNMTAGTISNVNASGVVVVDTRTDAEVTASRISRITSVDRLSSLRLANEDLVIKMDTMFNSSSDKMVVVYITDVGDPTTDPTRGSILFSNDGENFQVIKGNGGLTGTFTPDASKTLAISCSGSCTTHKGFFEIAGGTPGAVNLKHMSADDGVGTLGQHNVVLRTDGDLWTLADAHGADNVTPCDDGAACYHKTSGAEASMYLDFDYAGMQVIDLTNSGITKSNLKSKITERLNDSNKENELVLSYYCAEGYGDTEPEYVFVTATNGSVWRYSARTQRMWRLKPGEWAVYTVGTSSSTAEKDNNTPALDKRTFTVYDPVNNEIVGGSNGAFLHHNETSGAPVDLFGNGVYVAEMNAYGRTTLVYQQSVELTEVAATATILNKSGYTVAGIRELIAAQQSKIMGVKVVTNGKEFVYITGVEDCLRQVTLNNGDTIHIANSFNANAGYVEATVISSSVSGAYEGWKIMAKFDAASDTVAGDYQVIVSGGTITLGKLETRDIADLTAADLAGATTVNFSSNVYADYKSTTWLNAHVNDALLTVKAKETKAGSNVTLDIQSITYKAVAGMALYMADKTLRNDATAGAFYVMDNNGNTNYVEGQAYYFAIENDPAEARFYPRSEASGYPMGVFCYVWKDGVVLTSSAMGVRKSAETTTYLQSTAADATFGSSGTSVWSKCLGYHRVVTTVANASGTYTMTTEARGCANAQHANIGTCHSQYNVNSWLDGLDITNAVIVDARDGSKLTAAQFMSKANTAATNGTKLVVDFVSTEAYTKNTTKGQTVAYLVINDMAPTL